MVEDGIAYWIVEHNGWLVNRNVDRIQLGAVQDGTIQLGDDLGGGTASLSAASAMASRYWREYGDLSELESHSARVSNLSHAMEHVRAGRSITTPSAGMQLLSASGRGAGTGLKAVTNASVDTVVSTATLGSVDNVELWTVTEEDRSYGYNAAYGCARGGTEVLTGVATGSIATKLAGAGTKAAQYSSYGVRAWDSAQNVANIGRGGADMYENGVTWSNTLQTAGSALGIAGDFAGAAKGLRAADELGDVNLGSASRLGTMTDTAGATGIRRAEEAVANEAMRGVPTRGSDGHGYASEVLEGGSGRAFAGHGEYRIGAGTMTVPNGTSITMPRDGISILDRTAGFMERGDWDGLMELARTDPRVADELMGMATHLPGSSIPNFTLKPPVGLRVYSASNTVEDPTSLLDILKPDSGNICWAACTHTRR